MKKMLFAFLLSVYTSCVFAGYGGDVGQRDNRTYGSLSDPIYRGTTKINKNGNFRCMGSFVSKNIVIANSHCAYNCNNSCSAEFWNGEEYETSNLKVLYHNGKADNKYEGTDWAVLLSDKESKFYKSLAPSSTPGYIFYGGYGMLRIIKDEEIPFLKQLYKETKEKFKKECNYRIECINKHVEEKLKELGKEPLFHDSKNFKVQQCAILRTHRKSDKLVKTNCDSSGGDSGVPYLRANQMVGLNIGGRHGVFTKEENVGAIGLKTDVFYETVQKFIKENQN